MRHIYIYIYIYIYTQRETERGRERHRQKERDVVMAMYNLIDIVIIIRKHQEVCGNITVMIQMII